MSHRITITIDGLKLQGELDDSPCAEKIAAALPIEARVNTWGQEIYFEIGLACELTGRARTKMDLGQIAYWPDGQAMCVFFGRTPVSGPDGAPRAYSDVEPIGRIIGTFDPLKAVKDGQKVLVAPGES